MVKKLTLVECLPSTKTFVIFIDIFIYLKECYREKESMGRKRRRRGTGEVRAKERETGLHLLAYSPNQMAVMAKAGPVRSHEPWVKEPKKFSHHYLLFFQSYQWAAGSEIKQLDLEVKPTWNANPSGSHLTQNHNAGPRTLLLKFYLYVQAKGTCLVISYTQFYEYNALFLIHPLFF